MPALAPPLLQILNTLVGRAEPSQATNVTSKPLQVVCAWPVSGQYGPGSRAVYYALVVACVFAQKVDWLRNACLAAALLFPAIAAVHGIVLAAVHVNGAVDMDIYGAFQLCSIGILAAPVTVRLSRTYFNDPGRNAIFIWTGLILAGLLGLTVEFYRASTTTCLHDDSGNPTYPDASKFPYGKAMCGLTCSKELGPFSPIRSGSVGDIFVMPAPDGPLTFGTATILAAACCIPAILSLISTWVKILETNWKLRFSDMNEDEPIQGTNGATPAKMKRVNGRIRYWLRFVEIPVFGGAVLAILVIGEKNLYSPQLSYQTEPIGSIGQWASIVGTGLAALGSLFVLLAANNDHLTAEENSRADRPCLNCQCYPGSNRPSPIPAQFGEDWATAQSRDIRSGVNDGLATSQDEFLSRQETSNLQRFETIPQAVSTDENMPTITPTLSHLEQKAKSSFATMVGNLFNPTEHGHFDDSEFKKGEALKWPEIPGEETRNPRLYETREAYNGNVTPSIHHEHRSRSGSYAGSIASDLGVEGATTSTLAMPHTREASLQLPQLRLLPTSTQNPPTGLLPPQPTSTNQHGLISSSSASWLQDLTDQPESPNTPEVPLPVHYNSVQNQHPPTIVVSSEQDKSDSVYIPVSDPPASRS